MPSPFGVRGDQRTALFIDGPSFYSTTSRLGWDVDYRRLRAHFETESKLYRAMYFTALPENSDVRGADGDPIHHSPVIKLVDWLSYNEYRTITKPMREFRDSEGRIRQKGNLQVEIAVEMMEATQFADHMILFSGDGDLEHVVDAVQRRGVKVTVASTVRLSPLPISGDLRRIVDRFIDLSDDAVKEIMFKRDVLDKGHLEWITSRGSRRVPA